MKRIISVFSVILILFIIFSFSASAAKIPNATKNFFVNDFANVISNEDEAKMQQQGEALYKACGAQVVVATVGNTDGEDIESYSLELARSWGIGSKNNNDGILLLLSVDDRKVRIEVGYGLEGALPDSKTGRILDTYGIEHFNKNDFSTGLTAVYDSLVNEVYIEKNLQPAEGYTPISEVKGSDKDTDIGFIVVAVIIIFSFLMSFRKRRRGKYYSDYDDTYHGGFGGGFSGGGFSGGSSGGGFSGGGGSFGGGGSSRGF